MGERRHVTAEELGLNPNIGEKTHAEPTNTDSTFENVSDPVKQRLMYLDREIQRNKDILVGRGDVRLESVSGGSAQVSKNLAEVIAERDRLREEHGLPPEANPETRTLPE